MSTNEGGSAVSARRALLERRLRGDFAARAKPQGIPRREGDGPFPLSSAQERLWFLDRMDPGTALHNLPAAFRVREPLEPWALERAFAAAVRRHESLHTVYAAEGGRPVQRIVPAPEVRVPTVDLSRLRPEAREAEARRRSLAESGRPFDLEGGLLARLTLLRLGAAEHVLVVVTHHVATDGWSTSILLGETLEGYRALVAGTEPSFPEPPIRYADFAAWQREALDGETLGRPLAWWKERLRGAPALLELPTDRPRPAVRDPRGAILPFVVGPEAAEGVRALARAEGATPFMVLLAVFEVLLSRWSGEEDFVVGSPVAGRTRTETERMVGCFVNTLPLRAELAGDPGFRELLAGVRETTLGAYANQEVPFERLVEELAPERSLSHSPLFQVMFTLQNNPGAVELAGFRLELAAADSGTAKFDLTLGLEERGEVLAGVFEYATDLFDASTVGRMAEHYVTLVEAVVADPGRRVSDLPLMDAAGRAALIAASAAEPAPAADACIHHLFEAQAARTPGAVALVAGEERVTYRELDARAEALARALRARGVGPETRVGVCLERTAELPAAVLGVLKAGGAYVPLDPAYPADRLGFVLADAAVPVLVTQASLLERLPEHGAETVLVDGDLAGETPHPRPLPHKGGGENDVSPHNLAYLIYTSGSTGRPKGVAIEHRATVALLRWAAGVFPDGALAGVLASTSLSFDLSVFELFFPLSRGGTVVLAEDALRLPALPARGEVTLLNTVPSAAAALVRAGGIPGSVRVVCLAGEALKRELADALYALPHVEEVHNLYGPSEDTTYSTGSLVPRGGERAPGIGRPVAGTSAYVLDARMEPVPTGVPGELYLGGAGLARGYLGRPELTAERFVPDPFAVEPGVRLYRTGDRVRRRADGELEFSGRLDHQVKVRGFRVEPGEVESALLRHPAVRESLVLARGDALVGYVAVGEGDGAAPEELRRHLRERLPEHMVPSLFVVLPALPKTPNGKVDRRALPDPEAARGGGERVAPRSETERRLAAAWSEVLRVAEVGVHDNFFDLGGHSLLATQVVSRVLETCGVELPLRALFEAPTVAELAARVDALAPSPEERASARRVRAAPAGERPERFPLSFAQERLWFLERMEPGSAVYNIPAVLRLSGALDAAALERSLGEIVRRHESLRTTFADADGTPAQVVGPAREARLPVDDLSALPRELRDAEALRLAREETSRPFDLEAGPLFRAALLRLAAYEHRLVVTMHHAVSDAWSVGVLLDELSALYGAFTAGRESPLPELPVQYADYAVWQREWLTGEVLDRQLAFWRERLAGAPAALELPTDRPRPVVQSHRGGVHPFAVSAEVTRGLKALARAEGATLFMTLLAAWQTLLARYAGQDDVVVGTPVAGRTQPETEGLIGFFVNTLALRADLSGAPPFRALLGRAREATLEAYAHQDLPFERLVEALGTGRELGRNPVFQVMLALQNAPGGAAELPGLELRVEGAETGTAKFDLTLAVAESGDGLEAALEYAAELFDAATAERMAGHLRVLLGAVAADPDRSVADLPLMDAAERRALVEDHNATAVPYPSVPVHEAFAEQARRTPDAVAVVSGAEALTYAGLDRRAERLARRLAALGVGPEARVGICAERSPEMVVALLAVLKAGGAYVPLDPEYPAERLAFMLEDSAVPVLLTQAGLAERFSGFGGTIVSLDTPLPRPLPHKGGGEHDNDSPAEERGAAPSRANEFAATTAQSPPARTDGNDETALPQNWGRVASPSEPGGGAPTDASPVSPEHVAVLPSPLVGEGSGVGGTAEVSADTLAYVIYTSGSTGTPKGVAVPHGALANHMRWMQDAFPLGAGDRVLQKTPFSFDASVWEFWAPLLGGATLVMAAPGAHREPAELVRAMAGEGVTVAQFVPSLLRVVLEEEGVEECRALRRVFCGGEALPAELAEACRTWTGAETVNLYGPTEACIDATAHVHGGEVPGATVSIGVPISNTRAYVLDAAGGPAPTGVPGELYLGGAGLARGYLHRPELTAESFVPDALSGEAGARLYRTGDRARWLAAGELEYLGRVDEQAKVRGFRVEPGEVEAALLRHFAVREAAAAVRGDALVAWVVLDGDAAAAGELRGWLKGSLPEHMVPTVLVPLDALPRTPGGKVDRRALPDPEPRDLAGAPASAEPRTPEEEVLAGIWAGVLGAERVGVHQDFFELGGHSLLATQVVARVRRAFGVELPVRAVFEEPTVAGLAARVVRARRAAEGTEVPPLRPVTREQAVPLSFAQERLWVVDQIEPGTAVYNIPAVLRLSGELDTAALEHALAEIVRRHEALRTVFASVGGRPVQVVVPASPVEIPVEDVSADPGRVRLRAEEEARRPFDLATGPLFRARLLRVADGEHALLLCMHHVVSDGWSLGVLFHELSALYGAFAAGRESPLPELPVQYADYAVWQREWLTGEVLERQLAFWRERLAGAPAELELPTDRPRPAVQSHRGGAHAFAVPAEVARGLKALARAEGATLFMTLLAAWQTLLARYAGQDDVVVGTPVAGRTQPETEGLIGFFVNTLALRADLSGAPPFRALLGGVREATLEAYAHQDLPFERLVDALGVARELGRDPVFQVVLVLQNAPGGAVELPGLELRLEGAETGTAKFDLTLAMGEAGDRLEAALEYATDLFDAATAERMAARFGVLLAAAAADPDRSVADLPLLAAVERAQLEAWSTVEAAPAPRRCVHELFAEQARRTPDRTALVQEDERLTYAELDRRADRLAHRLAVLGVGPDVRAGLFAERSPEMVVGMLAVLKAGGAYVPVDPAYPAERVAYMLADAGVRVVLTQERLLDRLPDHPAETVLLDGRVGDAPAEGPPVTGVTPDHLAYLIYTSGSTGLPKGTEVPHAAVPGFFRDVEYARFGGERVFLQHVSPSWDVLALELWAPLLTGSTCVLYPGQTSEPDVLGEQVRRHGVDTLWLSTAYFNLVVDSCPEILEGVEQVLLGGEAASVPHVRRALRMYPEKRFANCYGPTECTVFATAHVFAPDFDAPVVPIGKPIGDRRVHLLDRRFEAVPPGVPGELFIGGPSVARGYAGRAELTAEKFVPDPFSSVPGARLYRTGDRVRWTAAGELEFLGRVDFQVKVRGFRVEPGEVESVLTGHPRVRDAVVLVREAAPGDRRLVAYVTAEGEEEARRLAPELRAWLRERMPEYMVPSAVVGLETLPLTPSGKVDRRALPAPEAAAPSGEREEAPRTSTEELLAGIWREVLGAGPGVHDDFFEMGGHSLLATQVVARVRSAFRVDLPVRAIFEAPTVAALAAVVDAARREDEAPLVPVDRRGPLPLSFAQERLWFLSQMGTEGAGYTVPGAIRLTGALDVPALERALAALVRRHETLCTVFAFADGHPVQVVRPEARLDLPLDDLADFPAGGREAEAVRRAGEEVRRPFDLAEGPLLRVRLLRLGAEEHVLAIAMHHIVSDGWSMAVLLRELGTAYAAEVSDGAPELPPLPVQYGDYAVWQRARFSGDALDRQLAWWKERLAGAPPLLEVPTDRPRPPVQRYRGAQVSRVLPPALADSLRELGGREGATLFMVLLGTLQSLLSRYSGQDEVVVGTPIAGRTRPELEGIVGPFINTLALRTDLGGDPSFRALLARVRETALGAYAHQDVPFDRVVDALQPERTLSYTPLFQVELALQNIPGIGMRMPGLEVDSVEVDAGSNKFDLSLFAQETPGGVHCFLAYDSDLFDAGTVERLLARLERLLGAVAAEPDRPVSAHPLLDQEERERVLVEWNRSGAEYPRHLCLHQLFEEQAARTPDAEAVRFLGRSLGYAELDRRANRLAHHLRRRGVGPEVQVGICMERGFEMFVAVLGILKAGGAYVPVDPLFPRERLAFTLEGVALVLAQAAVRDAVPEGREVLSLDTEWDAVAGEPATAPESGVTPENLAYVLYTSGSTGRPKGVLVGHRGMTNLCVFQMRTLGCGPGERVLHFAPLHFDASAAEIFMALGSGATVVTAPRETVLPGPDLVRLLREERVSNVKFTPSALAALPMADLPDLRTLLAGGEASTAELVRRWGPGRRFVNVYGPTENSVRISFGEAVVGDDRPPPIGRPLANVQAYVLDRHLEPVPPGVPGELYSAGEGVTRGYAGRPDLTAAAFLPDPFGPPGTRLYRTGDRARWREDGELEFLGRVDFQVKIRGFRIEPGEIEAVLSRHPELYECAVLPRDDGAGLRLVAYLVPREGARPAVAGVRAYLREHLPDYMVPSAWVFLDALPLGPSGKLDRRALPAPGREADEGFVAPRAGLQETIAGVWREVLGLERVGAGDNFFEVGGHSLLLVRLHARLREETGREVTIVDLFRFPTVASLAAHLEPEDPDGGGEAGPRTRDRAALRKSMSRRRG